MSSIDVNSYAFGLVTGVAVFSLASLVYVLRTRSGNSKPATGDIEADFPQKGHSPAPSYHLRENDPRASLETIMNLKAQRAAQFDSILEELDEKLNVPTKKLQKIVLHMVSEFKKGLQADGEIMKMIPSHVVNRPNGTETGRFLALDLGGTNFRACMVELEGNGRTRMTQSKFTVSAELKVGTGAKLFDFLADCLASFCKEHNIVTSGEPIPLGFTFSFPVNQHAINAGTLVNWSKGFSCSDVVDQDVVELLQKAILKKNLNINIKALVNDTVGTLMAHAYTSPQTYIGVILGTGTNAAYVENTSNIAKWAGEGGDMIINTEWGAYNEGLILPVSQYDKDLDRQSSNPKQQIFEKMISGMYLGEIVRLILVERIQLGQLFNGKSSELINTPMRFDTAFMSRVERDHTMTLADTKQLLEDTLGIASTSFDDRRIVKHVCELVGKRSARLSAAGIAALVTKMNRLDACTVAIDGSLFEHYPHFGNRMRDALRELLGLTAENIVLEQARDGSGQGAALIAALA